MSLHFPQFSEDFKALLESVKNQNIAIVGHMRPDGDCISSQFALATFLRKAGAKNVICLSQNEIPYLYENFVDVNQIQSAEKFDDKSYQIITVDCADYKRTNLTLCSRFPKVLACIDHHATNNPYAQINIIDTKASATAEILAGLAFDAKLEITQTTANQLYMGIAMDTRQFTTTSTRLKTFEIATQLVKEGADAPWVAIQLYQRERFEKIMLLSSYLDTLKMYCDGRVCIGIIRKSDYQKSNAQKADSDGLVDFARSINGVDIALLIEELDVNSTKGSLRAKTSKYTVNDIAGHFGGGGHIAAAGFTAEGETVDSLYPKILALIKEKINQVDNG